MSSARHLGQVSNPTQVTSSNTKAIAGIADRRMWDDVLASLPAAREVVRLDLRGYGESGARPDGPWSPRGDVTATLGGRDELAPSVADCLRDSTAPTLVIAGSRRALVGRGAPSLDGATGALRLRRDRLGGPR